MRKKAIALKGGKCHDCPKWVDLDNPETWREWHFHHTDPREKEYPISKLPSSSWPVMERELSKCILLCKDCHQEKHQGRLPFDRKDDEMGAAYTAYMEDRGEVA